MTRKPSTRTSGGPVAPPTRWSWPVASRTTRWPGCSTSARSSGEPSSTRTWVTSPSGRWQARATCARPWTWCCDPPSGGLACTGWRRTSSRGTAGRSTWSRSRGSGGRASLLGTCSSPGLGATTSGGPSPWRTGWCGTGAGDDGPGRPAPPVPPGRDVPRRGPAHHPGRAGVRRPRARRDRRPPAPSPGAGSGRDDPDGLRERPGPVALPAGVLTARVVPARSPRSDGLSPAPRAVRVLGARGLPDPHGPAPAAPVADGPGRRLGRDAPGVAGTARLRPVGPCGRGRARPHRVLRAVRPRREAWALVGLGRRETGAGMAVLDRAPGRGGAAELPAALRPARAGDPGGGAVGADASRGRGPSRTARAGGPLARRGHDRRPGRLRPAHGPRGPGTHRRARRGWLAAARVGRGVGPAGVPGSEGPPAAAGGGPGAAVALRLSRVVPTQGGAVVWGGVPIGGLRAGPRPAVGLLRASPAARRPIGGAGRPQRRAGRAHAARAGRVRG